MAAGQAALLPLVDVEHLENQGVLALTDWLSGV